MSREPGTDLTVEEMLQPNREVVDHYIAPVQHVPKSPLHATAEALSGLSNDLASVADTIGKQTKDDGEAQGKAKFWTDNAEGAAAGVSQGLIPAFLSPGFNKGADAMAGHNHAMGVAQSIGPEYAALDKTNADPAYFDNWFRGQVKGLVPKGPDGQPAQMSTAFAKAWAPQIQQLHDTYAAKFVQDRSQAVTAAAGQNLSGSIANEIDSQYLNAAGKPDLVALGASVDKLRQGGTAIGLEKAAVDKMVIDAITSKAKQYKNPLLLDLMDHDPAAPEGAQPGTVNLNSIPLSQTEYGLDKRLTTEHTIKTLVAQEAEQQRTQQAYADKKNSNSAQTDVINAIVKDPTYSPTDAQLSAIGKTDPLFQTHLREYRNGIVNRNVIENQNTLQDVQTAIINGGGLKSITDRLSELGPSQLPKAMETLNAVEKYNEGGGPARGLETPTAKSSIAMLENAAKDPKWAGSLFSGVGTTPAGRAAVNEYKMDVMQWEVAHPQAGSMERQEYQAKLQEAILGRLGKPDDKGIHQVYTAPTPGTTQFGLPLGEGVNAVAPLEKPAAQEGQPAQAGPPAPKPFEYNNPAVLKNGTTAPTPPAPDWVKKMRESGTPPKIGELGLSPAQRDYIEGEARKKGVDPQLFIDKMHNAMPRSKPSGSVPGKRSDATTFDPAPAAQQSADILGHPAVKALGQSIGIDFANLDPAAIAQVKAAIQQHAPGLVQQASYNPTEGLPVQGGGSAQTTGNNDMPVNQDRVARMDALPIKGTIEKVAAAHGFDPAKLKAMVSIESSGNPAAGAGGSYEGLLQLNKAEWAKYGDPSKNRLDAEANLNAGVKSLMDKEAKFKTQYGRDPSATELYLMHQQGEAGLRAHLNNPDQPAWKSMAGTGEGKQKGDGWAKQAIWGNVPSDMKAQFGSVDKMTSADFVAVWMHKLQGIPFAQALSIVASGKKLSTEA
jgi:hypothetical protein